MRSLLRDLRTALRTLAHTRGFTTAALCTLALGIGATAAVFSVADAVLLRPLPYVDADRLVLVWGDNPRSGYADLPLSLPNFLDVERAARSFDGMAAWTTDARSRFDLTGGAEPEEVQYAVASARLFTLLGVRPLHGRLFTPDDDRRETARGVVVSARLWARRFGASHDVADKQLVLNGVSYAVVGVLPPDFAFVRAPEPPDVWLPLGLDPFAQRVYARGANAMGVVARLRPGVRIEQAQGELTRVAGELARAEPYFNQGWTLRAVPLREQYARAVRPALGMMLGTAAALLLIGCFNVTNLLLARSATRSREIALRAALGASRSRLVAQLLAESAALALLGGAAAMLVASWIVRLPAAAALVAPTPFTPFAVGREDVALDGRVFAFAAVLTLGTGLLVGLLPAIRLSALAPHAALAGGARATGGPVSRRARHGLVVGQIALSLALLVGAGLLLRSYLRLSRVDPGFRAEDVLVVDLNLALPTYRDPARTAQLVDQLLPRVAALPGVRAVGAAETLPLGGPPPSSDFRVLGRDEPAPNDEPEAIFGAVTPTYFATMGIEVVRGRALAATDDEHAPPVAVINEALARKYFPDEDPIGKRLAISIEALRFDRPNAPPRLDFPSAERHIVGVVRDVRHDGLTDVARPEIFLPFRQRPARSLGVVARTTGDPLALAAAVGRELRTVDPNQPVARTSTMQLRVAESLGAPRARTGLVAMFALVAVALAGVGVYGVVAYGVAQRTRELGVRLALGARQTDLARLVMRQGAPLIAAGLTLGIGGAWVGSHALGALLYGVDAADALTFVVVPALVGAVALLATWVPARRAGRVDPAITLRAD
ncbi:permease [Gemmatirosa kalamazoonensis]|uniref:Permease n=1 Tax=Gemmatirosa kalamazoonensis TaxID=861299 RepID=W0REF2_9BACT|nr:ABC transporter permease [Gemmatirosa kalamazoonensis]AHG87748.1 permease [Gemmatirosa kalamazoonensis]